jgi:hypothetical protein
MAGLVPFLEIESFLGINNTTDPAKIPVTRRGAFLVAGENVDIDDEKMLHRRKGFDQVLSGDIHSLWSNGDICLFVEGPELKRLWPDYRATTLLNGGTQVNGSKMQFVEGGGRIFFCNNSIIGYIENGESHPFPEPEMTFKKRMVGGHLLEFFNSRLYAAQDDKIFYSDAVTPMRMDTRKNFILFEGRLTMMKAVADGMYVSAGKSVLFLKGLDGPEFTAFKVSDSPAYAGSAIKVEGEDIGPGLLGTVVMWLSDEGPFMGLPGGQVKNLNPNYAPENMGESAAIYRDDIGFSQYLCVSQLIGGFGEGRMEFPLPVLDGRGRTN